MSTDNLEIEDWKEEPDQEQPISTAWAAEWFGPEEEVENEADLDKFDMHVIYKGTKHFTWYFPQVKAALMQDAVKEFIEYNGITDATADDVKELKDFFFHYVRFMTFDIALEGEDLPPAVFEPEDIAEALGDEDIEDVVDELKEAKMDRYGTDKPQLH